MEPDDARRSNLEALADRLLSPSRAGGREACGDPFPGQGQREPTALGLQGKRSALELHGSSDNWLNSTHVLLAVEGVR